MEKIDRLGWAAGISFISYGLRIGVRTDNPNVLEHLVERFPPGWKPASSPVVHRLYSLIAAGPVPGGLARRYNLLYSNVFKLGRSTEFDHILNLFEGDLNIYVAETAYRRVFIHAGVVGWRGRAILVPGRSFSGKTTLVAELVRAGATYYSDEYAVLDAEGRVHPFARPLSIRGDGPGKQTRSRVEELGGIAGKRPLPVGLIVVSRYQEGSRWRPKTMTAGQGALALLDNTVPARRQPEMALSAIRQVVMRAPAIKGMRGEAGEVVESLLNRATN